MPGAIVSYAVVLVAILLAAPIAFILRRAWLTRPNARAHPPNDPALTAGFNLHIQSELTETRAALTAANRTIAELRTELERTRTGPPRAG